ncbi:MAG TPA: acyl-CoA thioesterase [Candidatus Cybelea sp.]|nr:acyl-CoA thioesterase [Candidatus Cybelea sp.]
MKQSRRKLFVDWGKCDPAGIVFYPQFFIWFDDNTTQLFASVGLRTSAMFRQRGMKGMPLVDVRARFLASCHFGDELESVSEIAEWGRTSFKVAHRLFNEGTLAVEGFETRVWAVADPADPARMKGGAIPQDVKDLLS